MSQYDPVPMIAVLLLTIAGLGVIWWFVDRSICRIRLEGGRQVDRLRETYERYGEGEWWKRDEPPPGE